uniref:Metallophosphoesterase n=1 Tax=Prevotella sp. GTC17259 TaxID=3236795 RepID=A0AB33J4Y8_9BACT
MLRKLVFILLFVATAVHAQQRLAFHDGTFKIAQFTDIHWDESSPNCPKTIAAIDAVIAAEKPDMAMLTGDVVTEKPGVQGWKSVIAVFERVRLPFVVMMGNHDAEVMAKDSIYNMLLASPYYVGKRGDADVFGYGNCVIPVHGRQGVEALLYCLDSNDYQPVKEFGHYDWIHFDQIKWYREQSQRFAREHVGNPLPALAFFHIPLVEYKDMIAAGTYLGHYEDEGVASAKLNSGMFNAFAEQGDVMGVFTGHDHGNDLIDTYSTIALAYGRVSGLDAYGKLPRGGRIIQLYEGKRKFDTWISVAGKRENTFYYPSAITSRDESTLQFLPGKNVEPRRQGVAYTYYEGRCKKIAQIAGMKKVKTGMLANFSIAPARTPDHFAFEYRAFIKIDKRGVYKFYTYSDDGSQLFIDGRLVVDNDGGHSARRAEGKVALEAGYHEIRIPYFEDYMGQTLEVGYASRDIEETLIPDSALFVE